MGNEWREQAPTLKTPRKDHACVATRLDDEEGILVTGGVDADNRPLASVEFFSIPKQEWVTLADLTIPRTEHGLAVINGIATVVGGVAADEFLASVEQLDSSNKQDVLYQREWRLVSQALSIPRYDFAVAHLPTRVVNQEKFAKLLKLDEVKRPVSLYKCIISNILHKPFITDIVRSVIMFHNSFLCTF